MRQLVGAPVSYTPTEPKVLVRLPPEIHCNTSTSVPTSWCFYFLLEWKLWKWWRVEDKTFWIFCSSSPLFQLAPPIWLSAFHPIHTNAKISKWLSGYQCLNCYCAKSMRAVKNLNSGEKVLIVVNVSQFERSFCVEVWMTRWALNMLETVWNLRIFEDSVICLNGKERQKNVRYLWNYKWYQLEKETRSIPNWDNVHLNWKSIASIFLIDIIHNVFEWSESVEKCWRS